MTTFVKKIYPALPKLTINGIDSFRSGKWTLHANAKVVDDQTLVLNATGAYQENQFDILNVTLGQTYTFAIQHNGLINIRALDGVGNTLYTPNWTSAQSVSFTVPLNTVKIRFYLSSGTVGTFTFSKPMLNLGSIPAPYSAKTGDRMVMPTFVNGKVKVNKSPKRSLTRKTGLSFNGVTDYLQLPSMTMDAIKMECLIDSNQLGDVCLFDARNGYANSWVWSGVSGTGSNIPQFIVDGQVKTPIWTNIPKGIRTKIKIIPVSSFTDSVNVFSDYVANYKTKGIIYKVTCYLNGSIVAQYDFENAQNIVGNQVIPSAQNLIPSFEDTRWSIHADAKVMGKDVLHLDATAAGHQSRFKVSVISGNKYQMIVDYTNVPTGYVWYEYWDSNNNFISGFNSGISSIAPMNAAFVSLVLTNKNSGSFDFIRPQLYQLSGKEGTLNGVPEVLNNASKRSLYVKR
jgi:hypothetical protein